MQHDILVADTGLAARLLDWRWRLRMAAAPASATALKVRAAAATGRRQWLVRWHPTR
jgi:hypothetical protein